MSASDDPLAHLGPVDVSDGEGEEEGFEDVAVHAARAGITVEKVLQEYARIAFADLRHIIRWGKDGLHLKQGLKEEDAAPISEIGTTASGNGPVRIKLYDKKAALDAIARYLGMFTPRERRQDEDNWAAEVEEAREELARRLALLTTASDEEDAAAHDEPEGSRDDPR